MGGGEKMFVGRTGSVLGEDRKRERGLKSRTAVESYRLIKNRASALCHSLESSEPPNESRRQIRYTELSTHNTAVAVDANLREVKYEAVETIGKRGSS